jgi:D-lactate dehydrogenase (cytochrome)
MTFDAAKDALSDLLGDRFTQSHAVRDAHGTNEAHFAAAPPDGVAFPISTEEISQILRICHGFGCPVIPYGAGTGLEGQHLATQGGITLDMSKMNKILAVQDADMLAVVQPGVTREQLNEDLRATGLFFPVDPGANASIGGMTATRASGTTAVRYGTMAQNVLALEVVMADGTIIRTGTQAPKSSAGYDMTHLMVGSEGTLGIITEITLRLQGQPEAISAATCRFDTVGDAVDTVIMTIQSGIPMARIELVDEQMVTAFNRHSGGDLPEKPHLFLEFHGSPSSVKEQAELFGALADDHGADGFAWTDSTEERNALWRMRHQGHYATATLRPGAKALATDVCVPISRLAEAVAEAQSERARLNLVAPIVGHVGDGNFHCGIRMDPDDPDEVARVAEFSEGLAQCALRLGGTVSGEHGIGLGKIKYMTKQHGPALSYMRAVKTAMDPTNILNPGKMLPPGNH